MTKDDLRNALRELLPSKEEICQAITAGVANAITEAFSCQSEMLDAIYQGCRDGLPKGRHHAR